MMQSDQVIQDIKVIGVEKPQKSKFQQHFEYVIRVVYDEGYEHLIFRRYSMLFDFHAVLKEVVKDNYNSMVVLPELPVARFQHAGRKFLRLGMSKELKQMTEFCQKIIQLPRFISEKDIILKFFDELGTDRAHAEAYLEEHQKDLPKEQSETPNSPSTYGAEAQFGQNGDASQDNENQFRSVGDFDAHGTGELSVRYGESVTVIEKNASGWWLVSNTSGVTGFTPATFLEPLEEKTDSGEEWVDVRGPDNIYVALKNYEAQCPDEITFQIGEELEVISMSNFGWWRVRRGNEVGLSPASSLTMKIAHQSAASSYSEDPMNEYRKSILSISKKSSHREREAPPRTSVKSTDGESSEQDHTYDRLTDHEQGQPEATGGPSVKYTKVIPKHLRPNNDSEYKKNYVNVPVIKNGVPHYVHESLKEETEAINVYVVRKPYQGHGLFLQEGETVQLIAVMPDGCHWKVATLSGPPFHEGLIPADLLCPELPVQMLEQTSPSSEIATETIFRENNEPREHRELLEVLPRFTRPPPASHTTVKKPVPIPRGAGNKSSSVLPKDNQSQIVALADYTSSQSELLVFKKGDVGRLVKKPPESGWWFIELKGVEGWVPHSYWKELKDGNEMKKTSTDRACVKEKSAWFCGRMPRQECEDLFEKCGKHLNFMVRESVQRVGSYVLSIKFNDKVHHFPIEKCPSGKLNIGKLSFDKLSEVISFYASHPLFYTDHRQPVSIGEPLQRT